MLEFVLGARDGCFFLYPSLFSFLFYLYGFYTICKLVFRYTISKLSQVIVSLFPFVSSRFVGWFGGWVAANLTFEYLYGQYGAVTIGDVAWCDVI